jgi:F0F1-type ATP synthase assembly protein I
MDHLYTLYDALISINVPSDKARAVVDAMERDMMDKLATKADLRHAQEVLTRDIQNLSNAMTIKLGTISGVWAGVLFALLKLT